MMKLFFATAAVLALGASVATQAANVTASEIRHVNRTPPLLTDFDIDNAKDVRPSGDTFQSHLTLEYRDLTRFEAEQMLDWTDADYFAEKTLASSAGHAVKPERVEDWNISSELHRRDLQESRIRLVEALNNGAKTAAPKDAAVAQVSFDCWAEQQEEAWQIGHILACRKTFEDAMDKVELAMQPKPKPKPAPVAQKAEPKPVPVTDVVTVYFDFDKDNIRPEAQATIDRFVAGIENKDEVEVVVVGHADRAGPPQYNDDLSLRRAEAVKRALETQGLTISKLKDFDLEARGEDDPAVPTADGVPEQANRRVVLRGFALDRVAMRATE